MRGEASCTMAADPDRVYGPGDVEVGSAQAVADAGEGERAAMIDGMNHTLGKLKAVAEGE